MQALQLVLQVIGQATQDESEVGFLRQLSQIQEPFVVCGAEIAHAGKVYNDVIVEVFPAEPLKIARKIA